MTRSPARVLSLRSLFAGAMALTIALAACASESSTRTSAMSELAKEGARLAQSSGCSSCHGADWTGGVGPPWVGLAGSTVTVSDGVAVVADADYLRRSIEDPSAQRVQGFAVTMPKNSLSDADIAAIVAFIQELPDKG